MTPLLDVVDLAKLYPVGGGQGVPGLFSRLTKGQHGRHPSRLHAVDYISLTIGQGETVGLVGESGCGKSTLVRLLNRLIDPTAGSIRFDGQELADIPARRFARHTARAGIQMVFQDAEGSLNPRWSAAEAIADPLRRLTSLTGPALRQRVEETADLCGLPGDLLSRFPHQLSGGQKARVGIARAIAVSPKLLILDEPTAALDVSVQVVILQLLQDLKQRLGMSYLFVSHDLNVVRLLCDRVLVMYLGKIIESGPASAIFRRPAHPYTAALLSAIPTTDRADQAARIRLTGEPRSPIDPDPKICRFYGRCPQGQDACRQTMPDLVTGPDHRRVACHIPLLPMEAPSHA